MLRRVYSADVFARSAVLRLVAILIVFLPVVFAATAAPNTDVRVSVVLNADGSRTTLQTNPVDRTAISTTTDSDGKLLEKIRYDLDGNGRLLRGAVYGPKEQLRFRASYKYDASGRVREEMRESRDGQPAGKIVFDYDATGRQSGYSTYDADGRLLAQTGSGAASAPSPDRGR